MPACMQGDNNDDLGDLNLFESRWSRVLQYWTIVIVKCAIIEITSSKARRLANGSKKINVGKHYFSSFWTTCYGYLCTYTDVFWYPYILSYTYKHAKDPS